MKALRLTTIAALVCLVAACEEELPPRTVDELVESPFLLEAAMVRCAQDRTRTKYDEECLNAREAANRLAANDREARKEELEAQSARKRKAFRRTQEAVAEARRRAAEIQRQREEDEYLGVYEAVPDGNSVAATFAEVIAESQSAAVDEILPGNQPGVVIIPPDPEGEGAASETSPAAAINIDTIREELKKRQDSPD